MLQVRRCLNDLCATCAKCGVFRLDLYVQILQSVYLRVQQPFHPFSGLVWIGVDDGTTAPRRILAVRAFHG